MEPRAEVVTGPAAQFCKPAGLGREILPLTGLRHEEDFVLWNGQLPLQFCHLCEIGFRFDGKLHLQVMLGPGAEVKEDPQGVEIDPCVSVGFSVMVGWR